VHTRARNPFGYRSRIVKRKIAIRFARECFTKTYYNAGIVQNKKKDVKKMLFSANKKKSRNNLNLYLMLLSLVLRIILVHVVANSTPIYIY